MLSEKEQYALKQLNEFIKVAETRYMEEPNNQDNEYKADFELACCISTLIDSLDEKQGDSIYYHTIYDDLKHKVNKTLEYIDKTKINDLKTIKDISNFKKHIKYWLE